MSRGIPSAMEHSFSEFSAGLHIRTVELSLDVAMRVSLWSIVVAAGCLVVLLEVVWPDRAESLVPSGSLEQPPRRSNPPVALASARPSTQPIGRPQPVLQAMSGAGDPEAQPIGRPRTIATHGAGVVSAELGWGIGDPRAPFVAAWDSRRRRSQRRVLRNLILDEPDHRRSTALRSFATNTEQLRRQLVDRLGVTAANRVLQSYRLHRYDESNGRWLRVDALGKATPVPHDDEVPMGYER